MNDEIKKSEITLNSIADVHKYLKRQAWKISRSQFYEHVEQKKLKRTEEGTFSISSVDKYALKYLCRVDGSKPSKKYAEIQEQKYNADARQSMADAEYKEIKTRILKGEYVKKDSFEQELTKRAAVFKSDIENFIRANAEKIIALVNGDQTKAPALIEYQMDVAADWMNRYASDKEFKVPAPSARAAALKDDTDNEDD